MSYTIFARKYRPKTFEEMIGQKPIVQTLQNAIKSNRVTQAYLFTGVRGVGKTTAARILAKALNCQEGPTPTPCNTCEFCTAITEDRSIDVMEIDGASNRGIDDVRSLRESVKYKPLQSRYKVIIIDEVHQLSREAFNALLKTLEEPPPKTVFIFATTEFHKVPATIVSRCQHFEFKKISYKEIINHLIDIAKKENVTISSYGTSLIAKAADGSLRDAQSLLDQAVAFSGENIRDEDLREILGVMDQDILFDVSTAILEEKSAEIFPLVERLIESGQDIRFFFRELMEHFRNLLLARSMAEPQDILIVNSDELRQIRLQAQKSTPEELLRYLLALGQAESGLRYSSHPRIFLESLLVKLCHFKKIVPIQQLIRDVEELQKESAGASRPAADHSAPRAAGTPRVHPARKTPPAEELGKAAVPAEPKQAMARILEVLQKEKGMLAAILAQYSSARIRDDVLEIYFAGSRDFYMPAIQKDIRFVEKAASEIFGRKMTARLAQETVAEAGRGDSRETETALKDSTVQYFMNTYKAQVLSVDPVKAPKEKA
ncbi:MAG: DNA polymerase III subunit gamma/tau [Acidobacteriota bacterium]|nr:DNA polymerase III subunit gamma/tau [Acidobacteriota bacterium]